MDPISAFGLAVNILTVVDLSAKVISTASEIWSFGEPVANNDRVLVAQHLQSRCQNLIESTKQATASRPGGAGPHVSDGDDTALHQLAAEAKAIAEDIQSSLVKRQKNRTVMKSLRDAVLVVWGERKMREKNERLVAMRDELQFGVIVSIKSTVDSIALMRDNTLLRLDENTQKTIRILLSDNENTRSELDVQMANMNNDLQRHFDQAAHLAGQRHDQLLNAIQTRAVQTKSVPTKEDLAIVTNRILDKIWFSRMNDRYEDIDPAHARTFQWIFSEETQLKSGCTFLAWIAESNGIYWLSGRAGTGKSTLMKYIADDSRTGNLFQHWAGSNQLITATYWFWDQSSDTLQKSLDGLYRGILHEVIGEEMSFAPLLFPDQFKAGKKWDADFPTSNELKRAFHRLVSLESPPAHIALLIDGLDEYSAPAHDQRDLAESLKTASRSRHMKIIASSRPETVFEKAFKDCDKLYLHELTRMDQCVYVTDKLWDHERMGYLAELPGGKAASDELVQSTLDKSEGIFLWIRLVVEVLISELDVCDAITDLQDVLLQFPPGLEKLFLHMMGRMLKDTQGRGFRCLWITRRSSELGLIQSPYRDYEMQPSYRNDDKPRSFQLTALCLNGALSQLDTVLNMKIGPLEPAAVRDTIHKIDSQLRTWCAGLLEMKTFDRKDHDTCRDSVVSFIHRSVTEFLDLPETRAVVANHLAATPIDIDIWLMKGLLTMCKLGAEASSPEVELIVRLARHANDAQKDVILLLDELDRTMCYVQQNRGEHSTGSASEHWASDFPWNMRQDDSRRFRYFHEEDVQPNLTTERGAGFLSIAAESGLAGFLLHKLDDPNTHQLVQAKGWTKRVPLLSSACRPPPFSYVIPGMIRPVIVERLLDLGANPNEMYFRGSVSTTPWIDILFSLTYLRIASIEGARQMSRILTMMIAHGADQTAEVLLPETPGKVAQRLYDAKDIISWLFIDTQKPSFMRSSEEGYFVPFEELNPSWKISDRNWGRYCVPLYPDNSYPPDLTTADRESIERMGCDLLRLLNKRQTGIGRAARIWNWSSARAKILEKIQSRKS